MAKTKTKTDANTQKITITAKMIEGKTPVDGLSFFGGRASVSARKSLMPVLSKVKAFFEQIEEERVALQFQYGQPAPENYPNPGQTVVDPALMSKDIWEEYKAAINELRARELELEWLTDLPESKVPKELFLKISDEQLVVGMLFFDIQETEGRGKA